MGTGDKLLHAHHQLVLQELLESILISPQHSPASAHGPTIFLLIRNMTCFLPDQLTSSCSLHSLSSSLHNSVYLSSSYAFLFQFSSSPFPGSTSTCVEDKEKEVLKPNSEMNGGHWLWINHIQSCYRIREGSGMSLCPTGTVALEALMVSFLHGMGRLARESQLAVQNFMLRD